MIVELQRDPDRLRPRPRGERRHDRAIDAARHRDDDTLACKIGTQLKIGFVHGGGDRRSYAHMQKTQKKIGGFTRPKEPRRYR